MTFSMVFPGQGSQAVGMLNTLADEFSVVRDVLQEADEALGEKLSAMMADGPAEQLNETVNTQPAMLAAGVATYRAWLAAGGEQPLAMAGHSLGEYTALVCAGTFDFADAIRLVRTRAQLMQQAVAPGKGAMAAVLGLDDESLIAACEASADAGVVEAVNFNAPGQVVIAGEVAAVEKAMEQAKAAGARRAILLPVSVPAHSSLMRSAGDEFAQHIDAIATHDSSISVLSAMDGDTYKDADDVKARLKVQLYRPVNWVTTIQNLNAMQAERIIECGPGKVLAGLVKRIDRSIAVTALDSAEALNDAVNGDNK